MAKKFSELPDGPSGIADNDIFARSVWNGTLWQSLKLTGAQLKALFATATQGAKADSAVQPEDLGSAAFEAANSFATTAQGALADTAVQPEDLGSAAFESATEFAPAAHVGAGGTAHALATDTTAGFMSAAQSLKVSQIGLQQPSLYIDYARSIPIYQQRDGYVWAAKAFADVQALSRVGGGSRINSTGFYELVSSSDGPRFDFDPVSLAAKGILIEGQATNRLLQSSSLNLSPWSSGAFTVTADSAVSPAGTTDAEIGAATVTGASSSIYESQTVTPGEVLVFSIKIKPDSMPLSAVRFAIYNNTAAGFVMMDITPAQISYAQGYSTLYTSFTVPAGCTSIRVYPFRLAPSTINTQIFMWGAQLEVGTIPTSLMQTTTAAMSRSAEFLNLLLGTWFNTPAWTIIIDHDAPNGRPLLASGANDLLTSAGPGRSVLCGDPTNIYRSNLGSAYVTVANPGISTALKLLRNGADTVWANAHVSKILAFPRKLTVAEAMAA